MSAATSVVAVVDDDKSVRESLPDLLAALGYAARAFASPAAFLAAPDIAESDCLLVDVAMPGMSGPELKRELALRGIDIPTVFMTAHRDEALRRRLISQGAVDCLFKPFHDSDLLQALKRATSAE
jgi:FixJ family two-component response regulator